jgi:hypothetical protein
MPTSSHLHSKLQQTLGSNAADELVTMLDDFEAMRGDMAEMRHEMTLFRADMGAEFKSLRFEMSATIEKGLREQTRFFFLAWSVILATIIGLYARV